MSSDVLATACAYIGVLLVTAILLYFKGYFISKKERDCYTKQISLLKKLKGEESEDSK